MNIYSPSNRIYIYLLNIFPNAQEIDIDVTNKKCWRWQDTEYVRHTFGSNSTTPVGDISTYNAVDTTTRVSGNPDFVNQ